MHSRRPHLLTAWRRQTRFKLADRTHIHTQPCDCTHSAVPRLTVPDSVPRTPARIPATLGKLLSIRQSHRLFPTGLLFFT